MSRAKKEKETVNFEAALQELNVLVEQMESGNLSLEDSLKTFERGIALIQTCQSALQTAEQKVKILTGEQAETADLIPYQSEDDDA